MAAFVLTGYSVLSFFLPALAGFPIVGTPAYHMIPTGNKVVLLPKALLNQSPAASAGWSNDPDIVFVPDSPGSESGTFHNFYQGNLNGSNSAPWAPGEVGVWRHSTTRDWATWNDAGLVPGTQNWGTGTVVVAPVAAAAPGSFARAFPGGPGIGLGVSNDSSLRSSWVDWPTSAVPPIPPPANGFEGDPFLFWEVRC